MCMYSQSICMFISAEIDYGIISIKYYFRIAYVYPIFNDKNAVFSGKTNARTIIHRRLLRIDIHGVFLKLLSKFS